MIKFYFLFFKPKSFFYNLKTRRNNIHNNIIIFFTQAVYLLQRQINGEKNNKNKTWFIDPTTYYLKLHNYYPFWTASCDCLTICARSGHKIQLGRSVSNFLVLRTFVCSQRIYSCINIFSNKTNGSYFIPNYLLTRNAVVFFQEDIFICKLPTSYLCRCLNFWRLLWQHRFTSPFLDFLTVSLKATNTLRRYTIKWFNKLFKICACIFLGLFLYFLCEFQTLLYVLTIRLLWSLWF